MTDERLLEAEFHFAHLEEDPKHARALAGIVASYLLRKEPIPQYLQEWLTEALLEIADGGKPKRAFGLTGEKGADKKTERDIKIVRCVDELRKNHTLRDNAGGKGAYSIVGEKFNISWHTVESVYRRWRRRDGDEGDLELDKHHNETLEYWQKRFRGKK